jgi:hypothetical protein
MESGQEVTCNCVRLSNMGVGETDRECEQIEGTCKAMFASV